jgi:acetate kinase
MSAALLILNAGSSSLKFSVFRDGDPPELFLHGQLESLLTQPKFTVCDVAGSQIDERTWPANSTLSHTEAIEYLFDWGRGGRLGSLKVSAAGHRVVHGGVKYTAPVLIDGDVIEELEALIPLAPLHQPHNLAAIRAVSQHAPTLPQVACFDTSFHRTQPTVAQRFAIPRYLTEVGVQRYGFHGLSYEYVTSKLAEYDPVAANGLTIVAHLGNGVSLCAIEGGNSVATTMSFTPLDGLPMGTRCGSIDPGVLLYLMNEHGMDSHALEQLLTRESGLLGVSGISSDMRILLDNEAKDSRAAEAIELFVYRVSREVGSLAAALGGLDAIVFTGGIGEHAASIRARICDASRWLGLDFDSDSNEQGGPRISRTNSRVSAWVIPTNEELMIALHARQLIRSN